MKYWLYYLLFVFVLGNQKGISQEENKEWFKKIDINGYAQFRYNGLFETNQNLNCDQCDKAWGTNGFSIRRVRVVFAGQIHPLISFKIQPDFAGSINGVLNFGQIRDIYFDLGLIKTNALKLRIGQSKVPYGFENLQSSRHRINLDRSDAINSAFVNERDLGVFLLWTPTQQKNIFKEISKNGLKGTGDYGMIAIGVSNGQPLNTRELNKNKHLFFRSAFPFIIRNQIFEANIQMYSGEYQMLNKNISSGVKHSADLNYKDERIGAGFIWYPKPFGIQAEYNIGKGPEFNKFTDSIEVQNIKGGYCMINYNQLIKEHRITPFIRYSYYNGGKKFELDARSYRVKELELGVEWQMNKHFELVAMYSISNRRYEDFILKDNLQKGSLLRIQVQFMF